MPLDPRTGIGSIDAPGGVRHNPSSGYARELANWEREPTEDGSVTAGMIRQSRAARLHHGCEGYEEYPRAMVKYAQTAKGIVMVASESVHTDGERAEAERRGFFATQEAAIEAVEASNTEIAKLAANRAYHDRRMSSKAQREAEAIDSSVARHLGEIPAQRLPPKKKPGRPKKAQPVEQGE